jgi:putative ABC transport system permease protein
MNLWLLVWHYLSSRPLNTALNILLLGLGIAVVTLLILVNDQLHEKVTSNSRGIDLVVGAKGSPMQLILCNIFHVDFPTGNISLSDAERIAKNRLVKKAIPMALGDSYGGYRIVGTTPAYAELYNAPVAQGSASSELMAVTLGYAAARALSLSPGSTFASDHGLTQSAHAHDEHKFKVTGVFARTNTVLDNLILTSVESVWKVHDLDSGNDMESPEDSPASPLVPSVRAGDSTREITSLLIQYRSAMGAIQMPRWVNGQSRLQAASPAFETARLFSILGVGVSVLRGFAAMLIFISALSIFIALYNSLKERKYDLAIMRSMGASRSKIFFSVLLEGTSLSFFGALSGLALAHSALFLIPLFLDEAARSRISGWIFLPEEGIVLAAGVLLGILCAALPAVQAYRTDISRVLSSAD